MKKYVHFVFFVRFEKKKCVNKIYVKLHIQRRGFRIIATKSTHSKTKQNKNTKKHKNKYKKHKKYHTHTQKKTIF